jgi:hypothetical protein
VCSALDSDWRQMATSPLGRTAVQRWVDQDPCFEGAHSAHDVLAMCREGAAEGWPIFRALLRVATGDQFAQQTVLQVLLAPGAIGPEAAGVRQGDQDLEGMGRRGRARSRWW